MLYDHDLKGLDLPARTLCLTFDDGPGPDTYELGQFLFEEGIQATFFVIGQLAARQTELLRQLHAWNHLIGNHTWSHPGLVDLVRGGGDPVPEIAQTTAVIRPHGSGPILVRPPYGSWREKTHPDGPEDAPTSIVAARLRQAGTFDDHVGPIQWDIVGEDWCCWRDRTTPGAGARRHLEAIERIRRGIVLLHDGCEDDALRPHNRTMQMIRLLVPALKDRGYRFVRLDAVPQVQAALPEAAAH